MDSGTGITPVMPIGNDAWGGGTGNSFVWIFGLLILLGMFSGGWGGFGNNNAAALGYENLATSNEVQRGFDNQNMMGNQREILSAVNAGTAQAVAATNSTFHDTVQVVADKYNEITRDVGNLAVGQAQANGQMQSCCCDVKQLVQATANQTQAQIAQNNYDAAMRDAATNANFTAQIQQVKDQMAQNKIEALQSQVNQLQLAQATNGVLRFPNQWAYGAGAFPPIFGGCCGNNV